MGTPVGRDARSVGLGEGEGGVGDLVGAGDAVTEGLVGDAVTAGFVGDRGSVTGEPAVVRDEQLDSSDIASTTAAAPRP
jgi:hypothetical protein